MEEGNTGREGWGDLRVCLALFNTTGSAISRDQVSITNLGLPVSKSQAATPTEFARSQPTLGATFTAILKKFSIQNSGKPEHTDEDSSLRVAYLAI